MADAGGLVVVGTPIGNLDDLSPRAAAHLRDADLVACEDTRRTATLLRHAGADVRMVAVHRHNEAARAADLVERMAAGARVALVSDAGMPLVSDPGARLVRAALDAGLPVTVVPGPSAVTVALAASGLAGEEGFAFAGFVPRRGAERRAFMERLGALAVPAVAFESPQRLPALLAELAAAWPERPVAVCRELTKLHEEVVRGTAAEVAARFAEPPRGEIAVVIGPAAGRRGGPRLRRPARRDGPPAGRRGRRHPGGRGGGHARRRPPQPRLPGRARGHRREAQRDVVRPDGGARGGGLGGDRRQRGPSRPARAPARGSPRRGRRGSSRPHTATGCDHARWSAWSGARACDGPLDGQADRDVHLHARDAAATRARDARPAPALAARSTPRRRAAAPASPGATSMSMSAGRAR